MQNEIVLRLVLSINATDSAENIRDALSGDSFLAAVERAVDASLDDTAADATVADWTITDARTGRELSTK
jgi:hypothetical protein